MMRYKLGRKPKRVSLKTPCLGDFLDRARSWPAVKPRGWEFAVPADSWGMLGNDEYGDCAFAGAAHKIISDTWNTGRPLAPTRKQALDFYAAVTGFDPRDPDTDQGADLLSVLTAWKNDGFPVNDAKGKVVIHKILGWAACDVSSIAQMRWATDTFGGLYDGIECPESAQEDTTNWTYDPKSPILGGHCVFRDSQGGAGDKNISWGMVIPTAWNFELHLLEESYAIVTESWLNAQGASPSGLDLKGLLAALKAL